MIEIETKIPDDENNRWRYQIDQFVEENQQALAALAWGLLQEWGEGKDSVGIDLKPHPHFVRCSWEAMEKLNRKVGNRIQEVLGILEGHDPTEEVAIVAIGKGQIKLINFQPDLPPPECFQEFDGELDRLVQHLEEKLPQYFAQAQSNL